MSTDGARPIPIPLAWDEVVPDRPFAALDRTADDLATLGRMLSRLRRAVAEPRPDDRRDDHVTDREDGGIHHIVLPSVEAARAAGTMATVGFFGQARLDVDHAPIIELEQALIADMAETHGIVAYHNVFWPGTGWGNLVVFRDHEARAGWGHDPRHADAVRRSPAHYHSIRLHVGTLLRRAHRRRLDRAHPDPLPRLRLDADLASPPDDRRRLTSRSDRSRGTR